METEMNVFVQYYSQQFGFIDCIQYGLSSIKNVDTVSCFFTDIFTWSS